MHTPKPQVLCLHGGGTSAAIFFAQTRKIRAALQSKFEFIYVDAPIKSGPGPGVLPYFEDSGPYYRWFSEAAQYDQNRRDAEIDAINEALAAGLKRQGRRSANIQGVIGFSQGTIVSTLLLWQRLRGDSKWANLKFGGLFCGGGGGDVKTLIHEPLDIPSVHIHGLQDPILPASRALVEAYTPEHAVVMEFDGGHHIPTQMRDIEMFGHFMMDSMGLSHNNNRRKSSAKVIELALNGRRRGSAKHRPSDLLFSNRRPSHLRINPTLRSPVKSQYSPARPSPLSPHAANRNANPALHFASPLSPTAPAPNISNTSRRRSSHHKHSEITFNAVHNVAEEARRRSSARAGGMQTTHLELPFTDPFSGKTLSPVSNSDQNAGGLRTPKSSLSVQFKEFSFNERPATTPVKVEFNEVVR